MFYSARNGTQSSWYELFLGEGLLLMPPSFFKLVEWNLPWNKNWGHARWITVEALKVAHSLVRNMSAVIGGKQMHSVYHRPSVDKKSSADGVREARDTVLFAAPS